MRPLRIFQAVNSSLIVVHLISRVLDRKKIFDDVAKERFRQLLAQQLAFSQIKLVTFCIRRYQRSPFSEPDVASLFSLRCQRSNPR